jgi:nicotinamide riboside kinase
MAEMARGFVIAIVGAEGAGKTTLATELRDALIAEGHSVAQVNEQTRHIEECARDHDIVIADVSPNPHAATAHRDLTLLNAIDLPWQADGAPQRESVEALVRAALQCEGLPYAVLSGSGAQRLASALQAVRHALQRPSSADEAAANPRWHWVCERCGDVDCERHLLPPTD